jgi:predicted alpha/beta-hydrolase family hydrolase
LFIDPLLANLSFTTDREGDCSGVVKKAFEAKSASARLGLRRRTCKADEVHELREAAMSMGAKARPIDENGVRGFLHAPPGAERGLALTHGAGGNCEAPLLIAVATAFSAAGFCVLRCDLPFRQERRSGPPRPGDAASDREGLRQAAKLLRGFASGALYLGGHSYGGRQASMLAAEAPELAQGLLLLSYPLHPPNKPAQLRTAHFASLKTPAVFVHGSADPFGTISEMEAALALIPAAKRLIVAHGAGHDLRRGKFDVTEMVAALGAKHRPLA